MCVDSLTNKILPFQGEDGGVNPTSTLHFERCALKDVSEFVRKHHYSHTYPGSIDYSFKLLYKEKLAGACLFGYMAGNPKAMCIVEGQESPSSYRELMRLVLLDEVPKNAESRFIGWCIRWLKKNTELLALISFADPAFNHSGIVYKASNWKYCGLQKQDRPRIIIDEIEVHPRMAYNRYGTSSLVKLKEKGLNVRTEPREPKHRFVYLLRDGDYKFKERLFN